MLRPDHHALEEHPHLLGDEGKHQQSRHHPQGDAASLRKDEAMGAKFAAISQASTPGHQQGENEDIGKAVSLNGLAGEDRVVDDQLQDESLAYAGKGQQACAPQAERTREARMAPAEDQRGGEPGDGLQAHLGKLIGAGIDRAGHEDADLDGDEHDGQKQCAAFQHRHGQVIAAAPEQARGSDEGGCGHK